MHLNVRVFKFKTKMLFASSMFTNWSQNNAIKVNEKKMLLTLARHQKAAYLGHLKIKY